MKAIPTKYRGTTFRSRLEARWAAFFDLVGWRWVYEPFDLEGWAPDFLLKMPLADVLVEVKPVNIDEADTGPKGPFAKAEVYQRRERWVLLLGHSPSSDLQMVGSLMDGPDGRSSTPRWDDLFISFAVPDADIRWNIAGDKTQWQAE